MEEDEERRIENMAEIIGEIADRLDREGVSVEEYCRIDMESFKGVYSAGEIRSDLEHCEEKIIQEEGASSIDEALERETGSIVCAFDEVADMEGVEFDHKRESVLEKNRWGGGKLKYGIKLEEGKLAKGKVEDIPIFYLALSSNVLNEALDSLTSESEEASETEMKLFIIFLEIFRIQIEDLESEPHLSSALREKIDHFKKTIEKILQKEDWLFRLIMLEYNIIIK